MAVQCVLRRKAASASYALDVVEGMLRAGGGLGGGVGPDPTRVARILCAQQIADWGHNNSPTDSRLDRPPDPKNRPEPESSPEEPAAPELRGNSPTAWSRESLIARAHLAVARVQASKYDFKRATGERKSPGTWRLTPRCAHPRQARGWTPT